MKPMTNEDRLYHALELVIVREYGRIGSKHEPIWINRARDLLDELSTLERSKNSCEQSIYSPSQY